MKLCQNKHLSNLFLYLFLYYKNGSISFSISVPETLNFRNPLDGKTALIDAIEENLRDIVEMLFITTTADRIPYMANYANNMDFGKTPLMYALTIDDEDDCIHMMGLFIEFSADIYAVNNDGQTVFQQAQQL